MQHSSEYSCKYSFFLPTEIYSVFCKCAEDVQLHCPESIDKSQLTNNHLISSDAATCFDTLSPYAKCTYSEDFSLLVTHYQTYPTTYPMSIETL